MIAARIVVAVLLLAAVPFPDHWGRGRCAR